MCVCVLKDIVFIWFHFWVISDNFISITPRKLKIIHVNSLQRNLTPHNNNVTPCDDWFHKSTVHIYLLNLFSGIFELHLVVRRLKRSTNVWPINGHKLKQNFYLNYFSHFRNYIVIYNVNYLYLSVFNLTPSLSPQGLDKNCKLRHSSLQLWINLMNS